MFVEDLAAFFQVADFATTASWLPAGGTAPDDVVQVVGLFDRQYLEPLEDNLAEGAAPAFTCAAADVDGVEQGDSITIADSTLPAAAQGAYIVTGVEPDGSGVVVLRLREA